MLKIMVVAVVMATVFTVAYYFAREVELFVAATSCLVVATIALFYPTGRNAKQN